MPASSKFFLFILKNKRFFSYVPHPQLNKYKDHEIKTMIQLYESNDRKIEKFMLFGNLIITSILLGTIYFEKFKNNFISK